MVLFIFRLSGPLQLYISTLNLEQSGLELGLGCNARNVALVIFPHYVNRLNHEFVCGVCVCVFFFLSNFGCYNPYRFVVDVFSDDAS